MKGLETMGENEKGRHKEEVWVNLICEQLRERLDNKYIVKSCVKLAHSVSLNDYLQVDEEDNIYFSEVNLSSDETKKQLATWNVDLFIGERTENKKIIPRIVIEAKYKEINTHDPITYSHKAELHKNLYPGLRYGLMVGNYLENRKEENFYIPTRCVEFGNNFDFIFLFKGKEENEKLDEEELNEFIKIIEENLNISRKLEDFLVNKNKKYWYITKDIKFGENISTTDGK